MVFGNLAFQLVAFLVVFSFCAYACIFADPANSTTARLCTETIPNEILVQLRRTLGHKRFAVLEKSWDHALQVVYLMVVLGSWSIMFAYGYPEIEKSNYVSSNHQYSGVVVFIMCMGSWNYACSVGPGCITATTIQLFDHYEYDNLLFSDKLCPTLKIRKLARSKYDRFSGKHVPRFDHYCGWLNQSVGEQNYRWFLTFLAVHVCMCFYGSVVMGLVFYGEIEGKDLLNATFFNAVTGVEVKADYIIVFHYMFMRHFQLCAVLLLMTVMASVLGSFFGFHLYITAKNMTTNEFFKWRGVRKLHKGLKKKYDRAIKEGKTSSPQPNGSDMKFSAMATSVPDTDVNCSGPVEPAPAAAADTEEFFDPGPAPKNIYDNGIVANFSEVFFPLSLCEEATRQYQLSIQKEAKLSTRNDSIVSVMGQQKSKFT